MNDVLVGSAPKRGTASSVRDPPSRPHVIIVGAGFGGLSAAKALARAPVAVIVIDERNYHLFQPLLYQVATAGLSPADIAGPIRGILARQKNARVVLGRVTGIDIGRRVVICGTDDRVILRHSDRGDGARHAYFGHDQWAAVPWPQAPSMTHAGAPQDPDRVRTAENEEDAAERRAMMTFVIIGGGPTGVERLAPLPNSPKSRSRPTFTSLIRRCRRLSWSKRDRAYCRLSPKNFPRSPNDRCCGWASRSA